MYDSSAKTDGTSYRLQLMKCTGNDDCGSKHARNCGRVSAKAWSLDCGLWCCNRHDVHHGDLMNIAPGWFRCVWNHDLPFMQVDFQTPAAESQATHFYSVQVSSVVDTTPLCGCKGIASAFRGGPSGCTQGRGCVPLHRVVVSTG